MSLLRFLSPNMLLSAFSKSVGLDVATVTTAVAVVQAAHRRFAPSDPELDVIGTATNVVSGSPVSLPALVRNALADETRWPFLAEVAVGYLNENDKDGAVLQVLSKLSSLPLLHFEGDHDSPEDFLQRGLFPLLKAATTPTCEVCGHPDWLPLGGTAHICQSCSHTQEF